MSSVKDAGQVRIEADGHLINLRTLCELLGLVVNEFQPGTCQPDLPVDPLHYLHGEISTEVNRLSSLLDSHIYQPREGVTQ